MNRLMDRDWDHGVVRYPDPAIEAIEPIFDQHVPGSAALERLYVWRRQAQPLIHHRQPLGLRAVCRNPRRTVSVSHALMV